MWSSPLRADERDVPTPDPRLAVPLTLHGRRLGCGRNLAIRALLGNHDQFERHQLCFGMFRRVATGVQAALADVRPAEEVAKRPDAFTAEMFFLADGEMWLA